MAEVEFEIEHKLTRDQAASKLQRLLEENDDEDALLGGLDVTRQDELFTFSGKIKGFKVSGEMRVLDKGIRIIVILPWAARPFREPANRYIRQYLEANLV